MKRALDYLMARWGHCSTTVCTGLATVSLHTLGTTQPWKASVIRTQSPGSTLVHVQCVKGLPLDQAHRHVVLRGIRIIQAVLTPGAPIRYVSL